MEQPAMAGEVEVLPERCELCPFFTQKFMQELKRRTPQGLKTVEIVTGLCALMRFSEIRGNVPKYEITHRRAADSHCFFETSPEPLKIRVEWLIERKRISSQTEA
ncbi:MAG: hypothetical protein QXP70_01735 [Methanomassiliicoccales archaeon]